MKPCRFSGAFWISICFLNSVEELLDIGGTQKHVNPFGANAWLSELDEYHSLIIHDFPKFPDKNQSQTRDIKPTVATTGQFKQTIKFDKNSATTVLSRTDPETSLEYKTTITWDKGKKWWSKAVTELGKDVLVSGELLP